MKKINFILLIIIAVLISSCTNNFDEFNKDEKNPTEVPGEALFSNAQKALADQIASSNVNRDIWKLWAQYWTETTYTDEANYNVFNRKIPDNTFSTFYRRVLNNLKEAQANIETEETVTDDDVIAKTNKLAIIELVRAYTFQRMVDIFGDIPYTDALKITETLSPKYDDAATIYKDLLTKVDGAITKLDDSGSSFGSADLYFSGDVANWKKFGNSLKLKLGLHLADVDGATAKAAVEAAADDAILKAVDACKMTYLSGSPNTNPIHADLVLSGRKDFVPANTIVDMLNKLKDPRLFKYFQDPVTFQFKYKNEDGTFKDTVITENPRYLFYEDSTVYKDVPFTIYAKDTLNLPSMFVGGTYGLNSSYADHSHIASSITAATYPCTLFDNVEMEFYLAEAAARGYNVGDAEEHYKKGIKASIMAWGGSEEDADAYIATVPYDAANWKKSIGTQSWIASYVRGFIGYTTWRRLDAPTLNISPDAQTDGGAIPTRFTYPINEQTLNKANYEAASNAIGGDDLLTKLFWDKN